MRRDPMAGQATRAERARFADRTMSNMIESVEAPLLRLEKAAGRDPRALMEVYRQVPPLGALHCCGWAGLPRRTPPPRILHPRMHHFLAQVGERYRNSNDSLAVITSDGQSSMHNGETVQKAIDSLNAHSSLKVRLLASCPGNTIPTSPCAPQPPPPPPPPPPRVPPSPLRSSILQVYPARSSNQSCQALASICNGGRMLWTSDACICCAWGCLGCPLLGSMSTGAPPGAMAAPSEPAPHTLLLSGGRSPTPACHARSSSEFRHGRHGEWRPLATPSASPCDVSGVISEQGDEFASITCSSRNQADYAAGRQVSIPPPPPPFLPFFHTCTQSDCSPPS